MLWPKSPCLLAASIIALGETAGIVARDAIGSSPASSNDAGIWLFRHFIEKMDCKYDRSDGDYWGNLAAFLLQPYSATSIVERFASLAAWLQDLLLPFGVADPVMALHCPLGTSAALREVALS